MTELIGFRVKKRSCKGLSKIKAMKLKGVPMMSPTSSHAIMHIIDIVRNQPNEMDRQRNHRRNTLRHTPGY